MLLEEKIKNGLEMRFLQRKKGVNNSLKKGDLEEHVGDESIKSELSLILLMTDIYLHYTLTSVPTSEQSPVSLQGQLVHEIIAVSCEN